MKKRDFLKNVSLAALGAPFYGSALANSAEVVAQTPIHKLTTDEDFWLKVRDDYKLKPDYINLESGYYNIIPTPTLEGLHKNIDKINYEGSYYMRTVQWENKARMTEKLGEIIGTTNKNIIITRNATESLDMVIMGMDWKTGDEAVYALQDYGAMKLMFEQVAKRYGVINKEVSVPNHPKSDEEIVAVYEKAITPNTKLLMVSHMINITGHILPVKKICQMAHEKGVQVLVDGAHCIGHFEFDITDLECDYYGSSLHKWLAVPLGTGLLYVADEHIDTLWPIFAEAKREPGDISRLNHTGTIPVYHDLTIENAIDYYNLLGGAKKEARMRYLQEYWTSKVRNLPGILLNTPQETYRACGIANVGIEGMEPADLAKKLLDDYQIFTVAVKYANVNGCRITPNVFTTTDELDTFVKALKEMAA
ncbi:aminotransferase class V-fold PLP-dependent enzyme [Zobellia alginiliquefaciens]|uniref:aminotransferase class V-fold PLP-dependent enzyme n=1 Tax=Zobellia alginiliquefaciens TaxID=3032586 RepID=UPI0023E3881A|nr:aminotransferase class V-fold PLP-dependent enzyme [Zobellia alginiliquefaciens]